MGLNISPGSIGRGLKGKWDITVKNEVEKNGSNTPRHKAHPSFIGHQHRGGRDFSKTFTPVAQFTTIRSLLALTAGNG